ncbi:MULTISPECIES: rhomboid family intramembrane serine protease [Kitasatospora]|uniref:Putative peptidase S54 family protein n=1 Tax=Kitasatospora setae (strain ATCC 33774 / DSM 43861 / JCM 3304 / KCC A-0304 / NBRC 14216 / KM-6054) TaxID=452652 RepID=E4MZF5_KITSK|nr:MULTISPECIES: rhomboid family intramembrane serine protease [Kitasatospora]BAJ29729.1 putative peptidase S54 family protein [Kitasatospora setae KM-6054]
MHPEEPARPTPADGQGQGRGSGLPGCHRHPERETGVGCARCGRPICPECMLPAAVGFQCPECVHGAEARQERAARQPRTSAGGLLALGDGALVTKVLIGINLLVFLFTQYVDQSWQKNPLGMYSWAPAPWERHGVAEGPLEWYRLVSAQFVHGGLMHIAANVFSLWVLGPQLERVLGRARYLTLYLVSGIAGNALGYLLTGADMWAVGASGAIFGLLGATAVLFRVTRTPMQPVIALLVVNLVMTFSLHSVIDWRGHLGGLAAGVALAAGMMYPARENRRLVQGLTVAGVLAASLLMMLLGTARLPG